MNKIKTPLTILSVTYGISFFDGFFGWGLAEGFYTLVGLTTLATIIWMWVIVSKNN
jgi:hypothetical protein